MVFLLILIQLTPIDLVTQGDFNGAINAYEEQLKNAPRKDSFQIMIDIGDVYLYWLWEPEKALKQYRSVYNKFSKNKKICAVLYRMGHANELLENYQASAKYFSDVVTKYRKCEYVNHALSAVERSFRKNYQDLLAKVDGWPITRIEIDEKIQDMPLVMRQGFESPEKLKQLIDREIIERLIYRYALKHKFDTIPDVIKQYNYAHKIYLRDLLLMRDVYSKIKISDDEIKNYYKSHKEDYKIKKRVRIKEIVVESESLAQVLLDSVKVDSAAWDTLAKLHSVVPSKHSGGNVGYMTPGIKSKEADSALFSTPEGEITSIVMPDSLHYAFYKIQEYQPTSYRKIEEIRGMIRSIIEREKRENLQKVLEDSLMSKITVEYYLEEEHGDTLCAFDHHYITQQDVDFKITQLPPFAQEEFKGKEGLRKLLSDMVKEELRFITTVRRKYYLGDTTFMRLLHNRKSAMLTELWKQEIVEKSKISDEDIKKYYEEHIKDEFTVPSQVRLRALIIKKKAIADSLYKSLTYKPWYSFSHRYRGEKFDSLINYYSINPNDLRGVDLGFVMMGQNPEVDSLVFPRKVNTILEPIFSANDSTYTIYRVIDKNPVRIVEFENAKGGIERNLRRSRLAKRRNEFLDALKEKAKIEYFLPEEVKEEKDEKEVKEEKK